MSGQVRQAHRQTHTRALCFVEQEICVSPTRSPLQPFLLLLASVLHEQHERPLHQLTKQRIHRDTGAHRYWSSSLAATAATTEEKRGKRNEILFKGFLRLLSKGLQIPSLHVIVTRLPSLLHTSCLVSCVSNTRSVSAFLSLPPHANAHGARVRDKRWRRRKTGITQQNSLSQTTTRLPAEGQE